MTSITELIAELRRLEAARNPERPEASWAFDNAAGKAVPILCDAVEQLTAERDCHSHNHDAALDLLDATRAKLERLTAERDELVAIIRDHHNGYDAEARAAMPDLKEPSSPAQALREVLGETGMILTHELAAARVEVERLTAERDEFKEESGETVQALERHQPLTDSVPVAVHKLVNDLAATRAKLDRLVAAAEVMLTSYNCDRVTLERTSALRAAIADAKDGQQR